ncbi:hypothetical protein GZH46_00058 [Fragariocoptes setiger]|uniref:Uncharacterized protein n=1 Tax=Fragariocoptes setiger TaxID=1670756 RepID=A0ABQ7SD68_9ACAR|nr:hypothetical protein GZH46_00058 [Fragariocoptes setiger]
MGHCNSYGFSAGFAALFTGIAAYLVQYRDCKINIANAFSDTFSEYHTNIYFLFNICLKLWRPESLEALLTYHSLSLQSFRFFKFANFSLHNYYRRYCAPSAIIFRLRRRHL